MSELIPTKPYMLRALHEWCMDNNLTPHLIVAVNAQTRVPMAYVKDGEIVLNVNYSATKDLHMDNDSVVFSARFGGVSQNIYVPMSAVRGIFARENGQGMFFEAESEQEDVEISAGVVEENAKPIENKEDLIKSKKPVLKIVK
ncbi:ClpXP protease specificity-enhancing factor [Methylotenera sp. L2L1]|uniref:ClpXP protease specificity-enhancing factor n=1 Tax=Methylotenera sp. L2L1 TaxID=1502770 RepID=UPI00056183F0|nr:ClpXP protease specificity-enhancing factor [Methylotenera sp. L2L1]